MDKKIIFWLIFTLLICVFFYFTISIITPFLIAAIIAYILYPLVIKLNRYMKIDVHYSALIIFNIFLLLFILIIIFITPIIFKQLTIFINKIPEYQHNFIDLITSTKNKLMDINPAIANRISLLFEKMINEIFQIIHIFVNSLWEYTVGTVSFIMHILLVPVVLYYFMRDWPAIKNFVNDLVPMHSRGKFSEIILDIHLLISNYIRGQLYIMLIMVVYYIMLFQIINIDLALLLGFISGTIIIIPYLGAVISYFIVMITVYLSFGFDVYLAIVTAIFIIGHLIEGYILVPKIIGNKMGVHPVWLLFGILLAAHFLGFVGVLLVFPLIAIAKILMKNLIFCYKNNLLL